MNTKQIPGWEGYYAASDTGEIISLERRVKLRNGQVRLYQRRVLRQTAVRGYLKVALRRPGIKKDMTVHRAVLLAWVPQHGDRAQVNHIDGNKHNNRLDNLEWCTQAENNEHARQNGLVDLRGENAHSAKLTDDAVRKIRSDSERGVKDSYMAAEYGVSRRTINAVVNRRTWKHIT